MESRAKAFGHPIHPMLIVFPLGLLSIAVVFDILYLVTETQFFPTVSYYNIAAGVIGGLLAALFGLIDWLSIPAGTRAKQVGMLHGLGNVVVTGLFAVSWFIRRGEPGFEPTAAALVFSFLGAALALVTGWLGGELVYRLDVGVDQNAHLNAPSSLSDRDPEDRKVREVPGHSSGIQMPVTGREKDKDHPDE